MLPGPISCQAPTGENILHRLKGGFVHELLVLALVDDAAVANFAGVVGVGQHAGGRRSD
jgi:hypothetical protein